MIDIALESFSEQSRQLPASGRRIIAHYDADSVVVYQAYRPEIAAYAVANQRFGGPWSLGRMSWIKPGFLWMMYRSGWASKVDQERVLAVRITRAGFDEAVATGVLSAYAPEVHPSKEAWQEDVKGSDVRVQWDPDHDPNGVPQVRRAIQIGLRGEPLRRYAEEWTQSIQDVTDFVVAQAAALRAEGLSGLYVPVERVYPAPPNRLGIDV